jgi:hypothetical protein
MVAGVTLVGALLPLGVDGARLELLVGMRMIASMVSVLSSWVTLARGDVLVEAWS